MALSQGASSGIEAGIGSMVESLRRALALMPLAAFVCATFAATLIASLFVTPPLALVIAPLAWLARHSWLYEREIADLYGKDSPEIDLGPR